MKSVFLVKAFCHEDIVQSKKYALIQTHMRHCHAQCYHLPPCHAYSRDAAYPTQPFWIYHSPRNHIPSVKSFPTRSCNSEHAVGTVQSSFCSGTYRFLSPCYSLSLFHSFETLFFSKHFIFFKKAPMDLFSLL